MWSNNYQILNKLHKLFIEAGESSHIQFKYQIVRSYMIVNFGENFIYNPAQDKATKNTKHLRTEETLSCSFVYMCFR